MNVFKLDFAATHAWDNIVEFQCRIGSFRISYSDIYLDGSVRLSSIQEIYMLNFILMSINEVNEKN